MNNIKLMKITNYKLQIIQPQAGPPRRTNYNSQSAGFTLIEVLLSITLLAIILGAVYTSFFTVHRAIERFSGVSLKYQESRVALDLMRREIEGAFLKNSSSIGSDNKYRTTFIIDDRDILGKTASRLHLSAFSFKGSGFNKISYYVQESNGKLSLIKAESSTFTPTESMPDRRYISEIINEIEEFTVETMFNNKWTKTWNTKQTGRLPEIVRISIKFDDKGKKNKLTEYARPRVGRNL